MDDKQSSYERIERYLSGNLSVTEAKAFEQELANDSALRQEFQLHKELQTSLLDQQAEQVELKIKTIGQEFVASKKRHPTAPQRSLWKRSLSIAAAITFLLVVAFALKFYSTSNSSSEQLFAEYYSTPALLTISRSDTASGSETLAKAYQAYEAKDYTTAIRYFSTASKKKNLSISDQYYQAICHLAKEPADLDQSIALLQPIIDHGDNNYLYAAHWYTAMAWLKKDQPEQAKLVLKTIKNKGNGKYKSKAEKLLQEMN